jgi:hypothetical protein
MDAIRVADAPPTWTPPKSSEAVALTKTGPPELLPAEVEPPEVLPVEAEPLEPAPPVDPPPVELDDVLPLPHSQAPKLEPSALQTCPPAHPPTPTQATDWPGVQP